MSVDPPTTGGEPPAQARTAAEAVASLSSRLPVARRGYETSATNALLAELVVSYSKLEEEVGRLREQIARHERETLSADEHEKVVGKALLAATSFAMKTREAARREADLILRNANAKATQDRAALEHLTREREEAERELARLRQLTQEMRAGLASFLRSTLEELRPETAEGSEGVQVAPQPEIDRSLAHALEAALQPEKR